MALSDPIARFAESYARAAAAEPFDAARAALATSTAQGRPSVRFVLVKGWDERGFVVYTNLESRKARELAESPRAALAFHWASTGEQVRVEGGVTPARPSPRLDRSHQALVVPSSRRSFAEASVSCWVV